MADDALLEPVERFVDDLGPVLAGLDHDADSDDLAVDVALEACNITAAFIDTDSLHTDEELAAFIVTFGSRFGRTLAYASPGDVRRAGIITGKRAWLERPSLLFDTLVRADRRDGTAHAHRYYEGAMRIAHTVLSLDTHPSRVELTALERFRSMLLRAMELADVPRPGTAGTPSPGSVGAPGQDAAVAAEAKPARPLEDLLAELDALVGLDGVKAEVKLVANLIQVQNLRRKRGLPVAESSRHLVFTGNPGTGKTTVARLLAQIYRTLGVVEKGHLVETDRSGLVAGYVGQTAIQVRKVFESALGGVLLVDEAYALARGDERDFGQEAIDTLVKLVEDHRDDVVVIAAGYPAEMEELVDSNPGLRSRFPKTIAFPDYSDDELVAIFENLCRQSRYSPTPEARAKVRAFFAGQPRGKGFGNGRLARNLFEHVVAQQASRIVALKEPTDEQIVAVLPEDIR